MPRRRKQRTSYVDLVDLVTRNCVLNRHHPYNLRPSTLCRQPGSMNERVLWKNHLNPPPTDYDETLILNRLTLSSRNRLHMASLDQEPTPGVASPQMRKLAAQTAQRLNRMATAVITPSPDQNYHPNGSIDNQFTVDETQSTVVLHHNPLFDAEGAKRSGMLSKKLQGKETQKKTPTKQKRASVRGSNGSKPYSRLPASAAQKNKNDKVQALDASSSLGGDFTRVEGKRKVVSRMKSELEKEMIDCYKHRDQELQPPPPAAPPMCPNEQSTNYPTLAAILESVDNFLRNVKNT